MCELNVMNTYWLTSFELFYENYINSCVMKIVLALTSIISKPKRSLTISISPFSEAKCKTVQWIYSIQILWKC